MADFLTGQAVYAELNTSIRQGGGNTAFAAAHGMNDKTLSNIANARRRLSDDVLAILRLVEVEAYKQRDGKILFGRAVYAKLNTEIRQAGGNTAFSLRHGLNDKTVSSMANAHRSLSKPLLAVLGLVKVKRYIRVQSAGHERRAA